MSIKLIQDRLDSYNCRTEIEEHQALREITQEVALASLGRGNFFKHALFQGGTCLRIFFSLNRFSEDLDFLLKKPDPDFQLQTHLRSLSDELSAFGYDIEITDRSQADGTVKKAFLKDDSIGKVISLQHSGRTGPLSKIRIKLEVDTNPPAGTGTEMKYLNFPFVSSVPIQDIPSLFSGKIHALLCRQYVKGRDWYDFLWYASRKSGINYSFLQAAMIQNGPWAGQDLTIDKTWVITEMENKIKSLDWHKTAEDVRRFMPAYEQASLDLWGEDVFLQELEKVNETL